MRLVKYKRHVEVCVDGIWAGVCRDVIMDASAVSRTLCKQLFGAEKSCKV